MNRKKILTLLETGFRKVFVTWENTNFAPRLRERIEITLIKAAAVALNALDKRYAEREANAGYPDLIQKFEHLVGYPLNLENPKTFCEKMQWRKLYDQNLIFPILSDKLRAKEWIQDQIGEDRTVPTLFHISSILDLPAGIENETLILKTNHDSGGQLFVAPALNRTRGEIVRHMSRYFFRDFGTKQLEWAYSQIERAIIAEPLLGATPNLTPPNNLQFHVFSGRVKYLQYETTGFSVEANHPYVDEAVLISPKWERLSITRDGDRFMDLPPRPREYGRMVEIAEILGAHVDYMRADFFVLDDEFFISETTVYHASGFLRFDPVEYDHKLGETWILPSAKTVCSTSADEA